MAQLLVRSIDDDLVDRLKERATANQRSAEAEHRQILQHALQATKRRSLAEVLATMPDVGIDADFARAN